MLSAVPRRVLLLVFGVLASAPLLADGPFRFYAVTPCRAFDSRSGSPAPLLDGVSRDVTIRGVCGVPAEATAVAVNATIAGGSGASLFRGHLRIWPAGGAVPTVSTINWEVSGLPLANGAIVPLDTEPPVDAEDISAVYQDELGGNNPAHSVHLILDVTGYFAPVVP